MMRQAADRWLMVATLTLLVSTMAAAQSGSDVLTVGTAKAARGQKVAGMIEVPKGSDAATSIPVVVVHGAKPGPVLALVSGAHGTEYASIISLERVIERLDPAQVAGTVIVVPLVNIPSFEQKVPHVNPVDGKSMNRMYPGKMDGTQTDRASYLITKEVVEKSDYLIDLHGGDLDESLRPYSYWSKTTNAKQDATSRDMVLAFGVDTIIIVTDRPTDPNASRFLENTATTRGKPSITVEAGYTGTTEPHDVELLATGCLNVMRYLKMLPGTAEPVANPVWIESLSTVEADRNGIFYPLVSRGMYVSQGMKIGYTTDYVNNVISESRSPVSGVIMFIRGVPSLTKGEPVASIGVPAKN